ncbi:hypothetical protein, partial [Acinetobacter baumannii]|uniref:hypothetical protein n=1 Tax=Acinetobacter baumannii TaxID=470 RepID=UPI00196A5F86
MEEAEDEDEEDEEDEDVDEEKEVPGTLETVAGDELEPSSSRTKWTVLTSGNMSAVCCPAAPSASLDLKTLSTTMSLSGLLFITCSVPTVSTFWR